MHMSDSDRDFSGMQSKTRGTCTPSHESYISLTTTSTARLRPLCSRQRTGVLRGLIKDLAIQLAGVQSAERLSSCSAGECSKQRHGA